MAAAIDDVAHVRRSVEHNNQWLGWLVEKISGLGFDVTPSVANFLLVHFDEDGPFTAAKADGFLLSEGVIVRRMEAYGLPQALRITVGTEAENERLIAVLARFKEGA